jgi:maleate isomerase
MAMTAELKDLATECYGARGRIALILPYDNAVIEPELAEVLPRGITGNVFRILQQPIDSMVPDALRVAGGAPKTGAGALLYCCVASIARQSVMEDEQFCEQLTEVSGLPARSATASMVDALRASGVRRIALLLPYPEEKCLAVRRYFAANGFETVADHRLGLEPEEINNLSPRDVYEAARQVETADAELLLLVSTNLPTVQALPSLQQHYSIPVLSTNACLAWNGLRLLGLLPDSLPTDRGIIDVIQKA